jgi:hypothetical protein
LTEAPRIKPASTRCHSTWQPHLAEARLFDAKVLFRQPGPAHCQVFNNSNARYAELIEADPSWMGHTVSRLTTWIHEAELLAALAHAGSNV